ncbi:MAG: SpoIIE family protein phosphatase [Microscillaceae bacterium]|nr:SpoIIE family protein phosphatase [Microscillaceae bacterium]
MIGYYKIIWAVSWIGALSLLNHLKAQTPFTIQGVLQYRDDLSPISNAKVLLESAPQVIALSDKKGFFELTLPEELERQEQIKVLVLLSNPVGKQYRFVLFNKEDRQTIQLERPVLSTLSREETLPPGTISPIESLRIAKNPALDPDEGTQKETQEAKPSQQNNAGLNRPKQRQDTAQSPSADLDLLEKYRIEFKGLTDKINLESRLLVKGNQTIQQKLVKLLGQLRKSKAIKPQIRDSLKNYVLALEKSLDQYAAVYQKSQKEIRLLLSEVKALLFAQEYQIRRNRIAIITLTGVVLGLSLVTYIFYLINRRVRRQRTYLSEQLNKINRQNEEINRQKEQIELQNQTLEGKSQELATAYNQIRDSLIYAEKIQEAFLTGPQQLERFFPQSFVFLLPKDIVSGDFYWFHHFAEESVLAVIDCTGHGVPGAFMTILANDALNYIVRDKSITAPEEILSQLDVEIYEALLQKQQNPQAKYGLELMLVRFDWQAREAQLAGTKNQLYFVHNQVLHSIKGTPHTIGSYPVKDKKIFLRQTVPLQGGEIFYLFSDGFQDQFGGQEDGKYLKNRFRDFLYQISSQPLDQQKQALEAEFYQWKAEQPQTDDVLIVGVQVPFFESKDA